MNRKIKSKSKDYKTTKNIDIPVGMISVVPSELHNDGAAVTSILGIPYPYVSTILDSIQFLWIIFSI